MKNISKDLLLEKGFTYKEISDILDITERQAENILNKIPKSLYNFLTLSYVSDIKIEKMFKLDLHEITDIENRIKLINQLKK